MQSRVKNGGASKAHRGKMVEPKPVQVWLREPKGMASEGWLMDLKEENSGRVAETE